MKVKTAGILGMFFGVASIVFTSVSIGSKWETNTNTIDTIPQLTTEVTSTLWVLCTKVTSVVQVNAGLKLNKITTTIVDQCCKIDDCESGSRPTITAIIRVLLFMSIGLILIALVIAAVRHFVLKPWIHQKEMNLLTTLMVVLCVLAGCCDITSLGLYNEVVMLDDSKEGVSFYFTLVGWLVAWLSAAFFFFGHMFCEARINN